MLRSGIEAEILAYTYSLADGAHSPKPLAWDTLTRWCSS